MLKRGQLDFLSQPLPPLLVWSHFQSDIIRTSKTVMKESETEAQRRTKAGNYNKTSRLLSPLLLDGGGGGVILSAALH